MRSKPKSIVLALAAVFVGLIMGGCSGKSVNFCSQSVSVAGVVMSFSHGLADIPESQYGSLRDELQFAQNASLEAMKDQPNDSDATRLNIKLNRFIKIMNDLRWDFSKALLDVNASQAAANLGTQQSLLEANAVESFVITACGMPSTVAQDISADTLPSPYIPSPTATEPPSSTQKQTSEYIATGKVLAGIYGVSISDTEAQCLGTALSGVVDATSAIADSAQYTKQFQKAFDLCGVIVPAASSS